MSEPRRCQLSEVIEFRNGLNFSEKNDGRGLPIVKVKDFGDRHFVDHSNLDEINPAGIRVGENHLLRRNDIVLVRSNGNKDLVGRSMIFAGPDDTTAFAGFCIRGRVDCTKASPQYIHYWLRSPLTRERFSREGSGTGIQNVSQGLLNSLWISLPPLPEQREIAAILGALDDKIEVNRKASATLEAMARAVYRSWFVDFDPVWAKLEGRPPAHMDPATAALFPDSFDDEGLPLGWRFEKLDSVCQQVKQTIKPMERPSEEFLHFSLPAFDSGAIPVRELGAAIKSNKLFVPNDAILFSRLNPRIPRVWWARCIGTVATPVASTEFFVSKANRPDETPWLYCFLSSMEFLERALSRVSGTSNSHQRVTPTALSEIEVVTPDGALIDAFGKIAEDWFERIHAMKTENQTLAALRDSLLPKLMSGEIRVGDAQDLLKEAI